MITRLSWFLFTLLLGIVPQTPGMFDCLSPADEIRLFRVGEDTGHIVSFDDWQSMSALPHTDLWDKQQATYTVPEDIRPAWELRGLHEGIPFVIFIDYSRTTDAFYLFPIPNPAKDWHCCGGIFEVQEEALMGWLHVIYYDWFPDDGEGG